MRFRITNQPNEIMDYLIAFLAAAFIAGYAVIVGRIVFQSE